MYYFKNTCDFVLSYETELASPTAKELYVAPLYNHLINRGKEIHISVIDRNEVLFCGVPQEYEDYLIQTIK